MSEISTPDLRTPYGYTPDLATAVVFMAIFTVSTLLHLVQIYGPKPRILSWMVVFPICGFLEILGWAGRLWSHYSVMSDGFLMQICCLVIAPTFISAGLYMLLGVLIHEIAPENSYLSAKWFKIIFLTADVISLVIQAAGGAMAAIATTPSAGELGGRIMLVGIVFQLIVMIVYSVYGFLWLRKSRSAISDVVHRVPGGAGVGKVIWAMVICSSMIIIRGFYRSVELGDGFEGKLAQNEPLFLLDAIPVALAIFIINALPPNRHLTGLIAASGTLPTSRTPRGDFNRMDDLRAGSPAEHPFVGGEPSKGY